MEINDELVNKLEKMVLNMDNSDTNIINEASNFIIKFLDNCESYCYLLFLMERSVNLNFKKRIMIFLKIYIRSNKTSVDDDVIISIRHKLYDFFAREVDVHLRNIILNILPYTFTDSDSVGDMPLFCRSLINDENTRIYGIYLLKELSMNGFEFVSELVVDIIPHLQMFFDFDSEDVRVLIFNLFEEIIKDSDAEEFIKGILWLSNTIGNHFKRIFNADVSHNEFIAFTDLFLACVNHIDDFFDKSQRWTIEFVHYIFESGIDIYRKCFYFVFYNDFMDSLISRYEIKEIYSDFRGLFNMLFMMMVSAAKQSANFDDSSCIETYIDVLSRDETFHSISPFIFEICQVHFQNGSNLYQIGIAFVCLKSLIECDRVFTQDNIKIIMEYVIQGFEYGNSEIILLSSNITKELAVRVPEDLTPYIDRLSDIIFEVMNDAPHVIECAEVLFDNICTPPENINKYIPIILSLIHENHLLYSSFNCLNNSIQLISDVEDNFFVPVIELINKTLLSNNIELKVCAIKCIMSLINTAPGVILSHIEPIIQILSSVNIDMPSFLVEAIVECMKILILTIPEAVSHLVLDFYNFLIKYLQYMDDNVSYANEEEEEEDEMLLKQFNAKRSCKGECVETLSSILLVFPSTNSDYSTVVSYLDSLVDKALSKTQLEKVCNACVNLQVFIRNIGHDTTPLFKTLLLQLDVYLTYTHFNMIGLCWEYIYRSLLISDKSVIIAISESLITYASNTFDDLNYQLYMYPIVKSLVQIMMIAGNQVSQAFSFITGLMVDLIDKDDTRVKVNAVYFLVVYSTINEDVRNLLPRLIEVMIQTVKDQTMDICLPSSDCLSFLCKTYPEMIQNVAYEIGNFIIYSLQEKKSPFILRSLLNLFYTIYSVFQFKISNEIANVVLSYVPIEQDYEFIPNVISFLQRLKHTNPSVYEENVFRISCALFISHSYTLSLIPGDILSELKHIITQSSETQIRECLLMNQYFFHTLKSNISS